MRNQILIGDCRETLKTIPAESVHCCVTSPPYFGLRDYGHDSQIGLEKTPGEFVAELVKVFAEVHRVLRDDGTLFVNMGDSYAGSWGAQSKNNTDVKRSIDNIEAFPSRSHSGSTKHLSGIKPKDLLGIPWMMAFALREWGWYLRSDLIWQKPAPMPGSYKDRCTSSHEHVFVLAKSRKYYWDWYGISEESVSDHPSGNGFKRDERLSHQNADGTSRGNDEQWQANRRNKRDVWTINSKGFKGAHFACFPPALIEPMVIAGSPDKCCDMCGHGYKRLVEGDRQPTRPGNNSKVGRASDKKDSPYNKHNRDPQRNCTVYQDKGFFQECECESTSAAPSIVLDPFAGSGTTAQVAQDNGRDWIMCEANIDYVDMIEKRTEQASLF